MRRALPLLLTFLLLSGCGRTAPDPAAGFAPADRARLVVYTSHKEEVYRPIVQEFERRTGIWVEVVEGGTNEMLERVEKERDAPAADVMFGGGVESLEACRDCFEPYVPAGAADIDPQFCSPDGVWTPFSALPVVLVYNTKLVGPEEIGGWIDLLSPEIRGRVAFADPAVSGSSFTALVTMLYAVGGERDETIGCFAAALNGRQLDGSGDVLVSVAEGTDLVGVTLEETALQRIAAGEDLAMVYPADGTSCVPDGGALIKGAPHGENARRFLDFIVSRDVQQLLPGRFYRRPVRRDVSAEGRLAPLEEILLVEYDVSLATRERDAILMSWAFQLGKEEGA